MCSHRTAKLTELNGVAVGDGQTAPAGHRTLLNQTDTHTLTHPSAILLELLKPTW